MPRVWKEEEPSEERVLQIKRLSGELDAAGGVIADSDCAVETAK